MIRIAMIRILWSHLIIFKYKSGKGLLILVLKVLHMVGLFTT